MIGWKMERPRASTVGWAGIAASVIAYDVAVSRDEQLTTRCHEALDGPHKRLVQAGIVVTALHLLRLLPETVDPFHYALYFKK